MQSVPGAVGSGRINKLKYPEKETGVLLPAMTLFFQKEEKTKSLRKRIVILPSLAV